MSRRRPSTLQPYPRRAEGSYLADDSLFPQPERPLDAETLKLYLKLAFERCLKSHIRLTNEGLPYSPNTEEWTPGFIFPYVTGLHPNEIYATARAVVGDYLPFYSLAQRAECSRLLVAELKRLGLVDEMTGRLDPEAFTRFLSQTGAGRKRPAAKSRRPKRPSSSDILDLTDLLDEVDVDEPAS